MVLPISKKQQRSGWIIWLIGALFYCYVIASRMYPNIMMDGLMHRFNADAGQLNFMLTAFYLSYATLQIPVGIIVDRFDIRKVLVAACIIGLVGQGVFLSSNILLVGAAGRFIIGIGAAFSYVAALKLASIWLPKDKFGLMTCATDSMGSISVFMVDGLLMSYALHKGDQAAMWVILISGLFFLFLIMFLIRDRRRAIQNYHIGFNQGPLPKQRHLSETLVLISRNPQAWLMGIIGGLSYLPSALLQDQWGITYFHRIYHMDFSHAKLMMELMAVGWIIAGPFIGIISDMFRNRKGPLYISFILCATIFSYMFFTPVINGGMYMPSLTTLEVLSFIIGVCLGTHPLAFVITKENFSNRLAGTSIGFTNSLIMLISYIGTFMAAELMDWIHGGHAVSTASYSVHEYTIAMSILPISFVLSLILLLAVKETGGTLGKKSMFFSNGGNGGNANENEDNDKK